MHQTPKSVIILENETDIANLLAQLVHSYGANPIVCTNEQSVLTALESPNIALALLDIMLPALDGRDIAGMLRKRNVTFPIYYMTGIHEQNLTAEQRALVDGYLRKPYTLSDLRKILDSALQKPVGEPVGEPARKLLELQAIIATEQENIKRKQASLLGLINACKQEQSECSVVTEQLRDFCMGLEASMARLAEQVGQVRALMNED